MFTVKGKIGGITLSVSWEGPGKISGDRLAVDTVNLFIKEKRIVEVVVPMYDVARIDNDILALATMKSIFDEVLNITGDIPTVSSTEDIVY